jgi:hypothetical protein
MQDFAANQATRDRIYGAIQNYLWDENKWLPDNYGEPEIEAKAYAALAHLMMQAQRGAGVVQQWGFDLVTRHPTP